MPIFVAPAVQSGLRPEPCQGAPRPLDSSPAQVGAGPACRFAFVQVTLRRYVNCDSFKAEFRGDGMISSARSKRAKGTRPANTPPRVGVADFIARNSEAYFVQRPGLPQSVV